MAKFGDFCDFGVRRCCMASTWRWQHPTRATQGAQEVVRPEPGMAFLQRPFHNNVEGTPSTTHSALASPPLASLLHRSRVPSLASPRRHPVPTPEAPSPEYKRQVVAGVPSDAHGPSGAQGPHDGGVQGVVRGRGRGPSRVQRPRDVQGVVVGRGHSRIGWEVLHLTAVRSDALEGGRRHRHRAEPPTRGAQLLHLHLHLRGVASLVLGAH